MTGMWLAAGSWQCISEEFKEINGVWGSEVTGENISISRRTSLIISSYAQRSNLREIVSSFVNKLRVFTVWAQYTHFEE